eukprot:TRINITY_DN5840_c0_g1_i1.p1 TRINITY_DN5840_c0_g1~~TRINITY_DN5840_c0_g1_i1.p1  ORF type:complete len:297 (+),score=115.35 TRINITY_DN5840_c0_g1_i1:80-970(+)
MDATATSAQPSGRRLSTVDARSLDALAFREFQGTHIYREWRAEKDARTLAEEELAALLSKYNPQTFEEQKVRLGVVERALESEQAHSAELKHSLQAVQQTLQAEIYQRDSEAVEREALQGELKRMGAAYQTATGEAKRLHSAAEALERRFSTYAKTQQSAEMEEMEARMREVNRQLAVCDTERGSAQAQVKHLEGEVEALRKEAAEAKALAKQFAAQYEQGELALLMLRTGYTKHGTDSADVLRVRLGVLEREHHMLKDEHERVKRESAAIKLLQEKARLGSASPRHASYSECNSD